MSSGSYAWHASISWLAYRIQRLTRDTEVMLSMIRSRKVLSPPRPPSRNSDQRQIRAPSTLVYALSTELESHVGSGRNVGFNLGVSLVSSGLSRRGGLQSRLPPFRKTSRAIRQDQAIQRSRMRAVRSAKSPIADFMTTRPFQLKRMALQARHQLQLWLLREKQRHLEVRFIFLQ